MANQRISGERSVYALVDSAPDTEGFWTSNVNLSKLKTNYNASRVYFSIREAESSGGSDVTVTLQFKCEGDTEWTDYAPLDGSTFAIGNRILMEDFAQGVVWRAGVKSDGYVSGSVLFGFDW